MTFGPPQSRPANAPDQKPAFAGQTRAPGLDGAWRGAARRAGARDARPSFKRHRFPPEVIRHAV